MMGQRIYLDNAATSWPKPESVYQAVNDFMRSGGAPYGRGASAAGAKTRALVEDCRAQLAACIGAEHPSSVVFTLNGTDALNTAIHGVLMPGDHVITTAADHNSTLRPLAALMTERGVHATVLPVDQEGRWSLQDVQANLRESTRLVAVTAVSNVTGALQPYAGLKSSLPSENVLLLLDACQALGHLPVDVRTIDCDLLASSGHKGLLGPLGIGLLYVRPGLELQLRPFRSGGTGSRSEQETQPEFMPDKFEAGNLNVPGIAGLLAGVSFLRENFDALHAKETRLIERMLQGLASLDQIQLYGPMQSEERTGIFAFAVQGYYPDEVASVLEASWGIEVRAGLHCAPRMHAALGTLQGGGLVRASLGCFTNEQEIDRLLEALASLA